jgi:hypothetical protein
MNKLFNSLFEMQLRILLLLSQEEVSAMSMDRIVALDFITIYGAEFKVADFNLNGDSLYKFSEIASRRAAMQQAIKKSVVNGFVKVEVHNGFQYKISEVGKQYADSLESKYAMDYRASMSGTFHFSSGKSDQELMKIIQNHSIENVERRA